MTDAVIDFFFLCLYRLIMHLLVFFIIRCFFILIFNVFVLIVCIDLVFLFPIILFLLFSLFSFFRDDEFILFDELVFRLFWFAIFIGVIRLNCSHVVFFEPFCPSYGFSRCSICLIDPSFPSLPFLPLHLLFI